MNRPINSTYMSDIFAVTIGICLLFVPCFYSFAQDSIDSEPISPSEFVKKMETDFAKGLVENAKWMRRDFGPKFLKNNLSSAIQDTVISTVNQLQGVHIKNSSGVLGYLKGVLVQIESGLGGRSSDNWNSWHAQIREMISNKKWRKNLVPYLQLSPDLFSSGQITIKRTAIWQFQDGEMELGIFKLNIKSLKTYEKDLIFCKNK